MKKLFCFMGIIIISVSVISGVKTNQAQGNNIIYYIDMSSFDRQDYSGYVTVKTIQGIVNRQSPNFFIISEGTQFYFKDTDKKWMEWLEKEKGYEFVKLNTIRAVAERFKSFFNGIITMDNTLNTPDGWHSSCADSAGVIAGLGDMLPLHIDIASTISRQTGLNIIDSFKVEGNGKEVAVPGNIEKIAKDYSTYTQMYEWLFETVKPVVNTEKYMSLTLNAFDYAVRERMFYFRIFPFTRPETDSGLYDRINEFYKSNSKGYFSAYGYVDDPEHKGFAKVAKAGGVQPVCDNPSNLSLFASVPVSEKYFRQKADKSYSDVEYDPTKIYVTFIASEADTLKYPMTFHSGAWFDPNRGSVPINYGLQGKITQEFPMIAEYFYSTATSNNYFFSSGSSLSGFTVLHLLPDKAYKALAEKTREYSRKSDQRYIDFYQIFDEMGTLNDASARKYSDFADLARIPGAAYLGGFRGYLNTSNRTAFRQFEGTQGKTFAVHRPYMYPSLGNYSREEQWMNIVDNIKADTFTGFFWNRRPNPGTFSVGYYGYIENAFPLSQAIGNQMAVTPTDIKKVIDYFNERYPDTYIFTTLDEFIPAAMQSQGISLPSDNSIKSIVVNGDKSVSPGETASINKSIRSITVDVIANDRKAFVYVSGNEKLKHGLNKIDIEVVAQDGSIGKYNIFVMVEESVEVTSTKTPEATREVTPEITPQTTSDIASSQDYVENSGEWSEKDETSEEGTQESSQTIASESEKEQLSPTSNDESSKEAVDKDKIKLAIIAPLLIILSASGILLYLYKTKKININFIKKAKNKNE